MNHKSGTKETKLERRFLENDEVSEVCHILSKKTTIYSHVPASGTVCQSHT